MPQDPVCPKKVLHTEDLDRLAPMLFDEYIKDIESRKQKPPAISNFVCPICGSNQFTTEYTSSIILTMVFLNISGYYCTRCTTKFVDPEKFSKNRRQD